MATLASEIIAFGRTTSDLKSSRFLLDDPDLLGFLNDLVSELYDMFVIEKEGYFQASTQLTAQDPGTFIPFLFQVFALTVVAAGNSMALATPITLVRKLTISNLSVLPTVANLGQDCSLRLYVNGVPTALGVVVPKGGAVAVTDNHSVTVTIGDTLTLVSTPTDPTLPAGSNWNFTLSYNATPVVISNVFDLPPNFYKEISLWSGSPSNPIEVPMLKSYGDRFTECGAWISANTVQFYPPSFAVPSPLNLDYVPTCPVLVLTQRLPPELEKFAEWLKIGLTIKIIDARKQPVSASMSQTFKRLTDRITKMVTARKASPRVPAMPDSEKGNRFWWDRRNRFFPYP